MLKVSVLMPAYNVDKNYLKESIKSILSQTFSDFELIIVDDGSKEDIESFINSFNDKRIRFYKNEKNLGVSKTRNRLLELAQGEYAAFQDADDISYPDRLQKQVDFLNDNPEISLVGSYLECFPNKKIVTLPERPKILDFLGGCMVSQPSIMFRISDFKKYDLKFNPELKTSEDYDLFSRAIKFLNFANIEKALVKYRINQNSLYHKANKYAYKLDREIKNELLNNLTDNPELRKEILKTVSNCYKKKTSFFENIFAIRNEWVGDKKNKIMIILGMKFKLRELKKDV